MSRDESIELEGRVKEALPGAQFLVELTSEGFEGHPIRCRLAGKMRMHYIKIVPGDRVSVAVTPSNELTEGRITYRFK